MSNKNCVLNPRLMAVYRRDRIYQTVIIDLVNAGVITKEEAEKLLGYTIPDFLIDKKAEACAEKKLEALKKVGEK